MIKEKVYCAGCRWLSIWTDWDSPTLNGKYVIKTIQIKGKDTPVRKDDQVRIIKEFCLPYVHNKNNNCKYYVKRKWYQ